VTFAAFICADVTVPVASNNPPPGAALEVQLVPSDVKTFPDVPAVSGYVAVDQAG